MKTNKPVNKHKVAVHKHKTPTFAMAALVSAIVSANALGQDIVLEEVVVTGVRASIDKAIDIKKNATHMVDGINAEDIGQLPDVSIADSIRRISGVSYATSNGRPETASIRGLGPDLTLTTLNGRVLSTTNPGNRRVQLGRLPSEIIQRVAVSKTPEAKMIEGGVAGTIALETIKPLDRKKSLLNVNVRGTYNENAADMETQDDFGKRGSISYIDQFFDDRLGVAFAAATMTEVSPNYESRGVNLRSRNPGAVTPRNDFNGDGVRDISAGAYSYDVVEQDIDRDSVMGAVQFDATDELTLLFDAAYVKEDFQLINNRLVIEGMLAPFMGPQPGSDTVIDGNGIIVSSSDARAAVVNFRNPNLNKDKTTNIGVGAIYENDLWTFSTDLSLSKSSRDRTNMTSITQLVTDNTLPIIGAPPNQPFRRAVSFDVTNTGENIVLGFDPGVQDVSQWQLRNVLDLVDHSEDEIKSLKLDFTRSFDSGILSSVDFGARFEDHTYDRNQDRNNYRFQRGGPSAVQDANRPYLDASFLEPGIYGGDGSVESIVSNFPFQGYYDAFGIESSNNPDLITTPAWPVWNVDAIVAEAKNPSDPAANNLVVWDEVNNFDRPQTYTINEESQAVYLQGNFDTGLWGRDFTGNVGLRVVNTKVSSNGTQIRDVNELDPQFLPGANPNDSFTVDVTDDMLINSTIEHDYTVFLPSYNGSIEIVPELFLRTAAARTMARAPFSDLSNSSSLGNASGEMQNLVTNVGNPALDPFLADQVDLALEWYPGRDLSLSGNVFYKRVDGYLTTDIETSERVVDGVTIPVIHRVPVNSTEKFTYKGIELSYQQAFTFLPGLLDGFGVQANASFNDTDAEDEAVGLDGEVITVYANNVAKEVYNFIAYYEKDWGSVRLAWNKQSSYNRTESFLNATQKRPNGLLDMNVNYNVTDNARLTLSVANLTDEKIERYLFLNPDSGESMIPQGYTATGRTITFGASYKF